MRTGITRFAGRALAALLLCAVTLAAAPVQARHARMLTDPDLDAALVIDARTGAVLYARNAAAARHPASLTKMMTLYLLFERLRRHEISLDTRLAVSANAAAQPRSHLNLNPGDAISVDMAIKAIVVSSANDATVAVAEALGGNERRFSDAMNAKARGLGMTHTFFHNATGLPDDEQVTTAEDLSRLARHLVYDFPEYFAYFHTAQMNWDGVDYTNHNSLIGSYQGADGIKTGYIDASGYNLVGTAERGGRRLIAVVMGGLTAEKRDEAMVALLDTSFETPSPPMLQPPADRGTRPASPPARPTRAPSPAPLPGAIAGAFVAMTALTPASPLAWATALAAVAAAALAP